MTDAGALPKWGPTEKGNWLSQQKIQRSYSADVLSKIEEFKRMNDLEVEKYGALSYDAEKYPLYAVKTTPFDPSKMTALVTGGVHGYETSGIHGALQFIETEMKYYRNDFNFIVTPCISPWGYETINRWNNNADDVNRQFFEGGPSEEANAVMAYIKSLNVKLNLHIDLHETTDTDKTVFGPAKASRDGEVFDEEEEIPDGFYLCGDSACQEEAFQKAVIDSVRKVTHIAAADQKNQIIGTDVAQEGVVYYPVKQLCLCIGTFDGSFRTTTEVYPDGKASPEECNLAQVAAVTGALEYVKGTCH